MIIADKILLEYRVTEKAANLSANFNQYTFEVAPNANRIEVARAVAKVFDVEVVKVNILNKKTQA
jgi:large subunit ribosomal protein L23